MSYRYLSEINPRFIYVWGGGFGYGPKVFGGSYDILGQAHAGLASITGMHEYMGGHCSKCTNWIIDWQSGNLIICAIMAAIHHRRKTGLGTMMNSPGAGPHPYAGPYHDDVRQVRHRPPALGQLGHATGSPRHHFVRQVRFPGCRQSAGQFDARYAMVSAFQDQDFKELCAITGLKELYEKYKAHKDRVEGEAQVEIYTALERWAADKSRSQVAKILTDAGLLAEPVQNDREVYESPHYREEARSGGWTILCSVIWWSMAATAPG